jgi:hypothetical protein
MAAVVATNADGRPDAGRVGVEDVAGVRSRVSWQAILAGAALALSLSFLLALLGGAVGLSVRDTVDGRTIGVGAAVFAVVVTALSLFAGGYVASQMTAGENKQEGALYGLFVWAAAFAMLLFLTAGGVRAGYGALVGAATAAAPQEGWEAAARRQGGYSQQQLDEFKGRVKAATEDPAARQEAEREAAEVATRVTWWTFAGAMLSMAAAAGGGFVGAGPTFRLFAVPVVRRGGYATH